MVHISARDLILKLLQQSNLDVPVMVKIEEEQYPVKCIMKEFEEDEGDPIIIGEESANVEEGEISTFLIVADSD